MLATYSSERLSMANKKDTLSAKQHLFATLVGSAGLTLTQAKSLTSGRKAHDSLHTPRFPPSSNSILLSGRLLHIA